MKSTKGFGVIEVFVILLIVSVGVICVLVYTNKVRQNQSDLVPTVTLVPSVDLSPTPTVSTSPSAIESKSYDLDEYGFTIIVPGMYTIERRNVTVLCSQLQGIVRNLSSCSQVQMQVPQVAVVSSERTSDGTKYGITVRPAPYDVGINCDNGTSSFIDVVFLHGDRSLYSCQDKTTGEIHAATVNSSDTVLSLPDSSPYTSLFVNINAKNETMFQDYIKILTTAELTAYR
ncbi:hypothetical protein HGA91_03695 [candidate division WWE3 bacterium]|nr:hypothetical protein [candidate division WWE3 bacterium]